MKSSRCCCKWPATLALFLFAPILALAQGGAYTVQGQVGTKSGITRAYLNYGEGAAYHLDSTIVAGGRFAFMGTVAAPARARLQVARRPLRFPLHQQPAELTLYVEPGEIRLSSPDSLAHAVLGGTPLNSDQQRLAALTYVTEQQTTALVREWLATSKAQREEKAFETRFNERYEEVKKRRDSVLTRFVQANPHTLVSLYAVKDIGGFVIDPAVVGPLYEGLAPAVRATKLGQLYATKLAAARRLAIGAAAPDFTQNDPNGKPLKLSSFRGKYVLLDFWASWCGPCRRESPNLVATYQRFKNQNFTMLGVSIDDSHTREAWLRAIAADGLTWPQVSDLKGDQNEAAQLYNIDAVPQNLLISPDGRIVAKNLHGEELGQKLAAVLPATAQ